MDDKISAVVGKLQQRLGDDYEVRIVDVTKNNDTVKKGISVRKKSINWKFSFISFCGIWVQYLLHTLP